MNPDAIAHGMNGTLVKADWAPLTPSEIEGVLRLYPSLGGPARILFTSPRPFSAAAVVETQGGRVFVKRHHRLVRDREGLLEEHRFIEHLYGNGAAVPRVLATSTDETAIAIDDWTYEVHEAPAGVDIYRDAHSWTPFRSTQHAWSAGQALARMHVAARGHDAPRRGIQPLVSSFTIFAAKDPFKALNEYVEARPALRQSRQTSDACNEALELLAPFHAELMPLLPALEPLWTHNDLHASNLLWSGAGDDAHATAIIDFGLADRTNAVHDLALAIERNVVEWLALGADSKRAGALPVHFDALGALLGGYESVRALSAEEAQALAPMTAVCHAEFALSEADYFLGVLHSEEKAKLAFDYLVNHARWFRREAGAVLLDAIRSWPFSGREGGAA